VVGQGCGAPGEDDVQVVRELFLALAGASDDGERRAPRG
jgi:hypothetical protein